MLATVWSCYNGPKNDLMKHWWKRNSRQCLHIATALVVVGLFVFVAPEANAQSFVGRITDNVAAWFITAIANFVQLLASFVTLLLINVLRWMQPVLQYNSFITHPTVKMGWEVVRNLANTGLIAIMLVVAFGTMFGVSKVSWQKQVPRIIIAAIAVNFSRLITGIFIDIGQVIMNAFVNALQQVGYANFFEMLQIRNYQTLNANPDGLAAGAATAVLMTSLFALIQGLIALVVIAIIFVVLVYRIVVLWVVVIMSPAAFAAGAAQGMLSKAGGMYSQWWDKLTAAVMLGPILAFFLWLSLAATSSGLTDGFDPEGKLVEDVTTSPIVNESECLNNILTYVIGIALLLAGLEIASQTAGALGGVAASAVNKGTGISKRLAAAPVAIAGAGAAFGVRQGIKGTKAVARGGVDLAVDQVRGRTAEFRRYARGRLGNFADRSLAGGVGSRIVGRAARGLGSRLDQSALLGEDAARKRLAREEKGFGSGLSQQERLDYIRNNANAGSERVQARVSSLRASMASNKDQMNELLQGSPEQANQARELMRDAAKHYEDTGDEAAAKRLKDRMARDLRLQHGDAGAMQNALENMSDADLQKLDASNFQDANFRQAMRDSGILARITAAGGGAGYNSAFMQGARRSAANAGLDARQATRFEDEQDRIAGLPGGAAAREIPEASNNAANQLINAFSSGTLSEALSSGLRLQDIDLDEMRSSGTLSPAFENDLVAAISDALAQGSSVGTVESLMNASRNGDAPQEQARAQEMLRFMSGTNTAGIDIVDRLDTDVNAGTITGGAARAIRAHRVLRNQTVAGEGDLSGYNASAAGGFTNERDRRQFRNALTSSPSVVLNIDQHLGANGASATDVARQVATAFDRDALNKLLERFEGSRGTEQEAVNRRIIQRVGQVLQGQQGRAGNSDELEEQLQTAIRHFNTRINTQV